MSSDRTNTNKPADLIIMNGRIATQDERRSFVSAAAIKDDRFLTVGSDKDVLAHRGSLTKVIDLGGRTVGHRSRNTVVTSERKESRKTIR